MRSALALFPERPELRDELATWMLQADDPREVLLARTALKTHSAALTAGLWQRAWDKKTPVTARFRALVALASFDPNGPGWKVSGGLVVEQLLKANPLYLRDWILALQPAAGTLIPLLADVFRGRRQADKRQVAAEVLAIFARDDLTLLADLVADSDPDQFAVLLPLLERQRDKATEWFKQELARRAPEAGREPERIAVARRQAVAAIALLRLGRDGHAWPLLGQSAWPDARSYMIRDFAPRGVDVAMIITQLGAETDASIRRALILALGEYTAEQLPAASQGSLMPVLIDWYRTDPDAGVHGAMDWLLRHDKEGAVPRNLVWDVGKDLVSIDKELAGIAPPENQGWLVTKSGFTMTIVTGPVEFRMGTPLTEPEREDEETRHRQRIDRSFAVAPKAVTVEQYQRFLRANPWISHGQETDRYSPEPGGPAIAVNWYDAAQYCRWLSEAEGIPESEMCYPPLNQIEKCKDGVTALRVPADCLRRTGYRLLTEAEWEYVCRAGTETARYYGGDVELLPRYSWYLQNSADRTWPVGEKRPNDLGMFDMHGNSWTWCQDAAGPYRSAENAAGDNEGPGDVRDDLRRILRGGSFGGGASITRSGYRYKFAPTYRYVSVGFRVARTYRIRGQAQDRPGR
jgi:formylglycine-generating enzyme required for sulfatase activity